MTWNYRVVRSNSRGGEEYLSIRTAWYDDDKETPHSIGEKPMHPVGCDVEELGADLILMMKALPKPILIEEDFDKKIETIHKP